MAGSSTKQGRGRRRPEDIDLHVASRLRTRRIMLGLTRKQLANSIGVTSTQAYKYETGGNRLTSGRLHQIAQALNTDVGYFFEGIARDDTFMPTQQQRLLLDLARNFTAIPISQVPRGNRLDGARPSRARCWTLGCARFAPPRCQAGVMTAAGHNTVASRWCCDT